MATVQRQSDDARGSIHSDAAGNCGCMASESFMDSAHQLICIPLCDLRVAPLASHMSVCFITSDVKHVQQLKAICVNPPWLLNGYASAAWLGRHETIHAPVKACGTQPHALLNAQIVRAFPVATLARPFEGKPGLSLPGILGDFSN